MTAVVVSGLVKSFGPVRAVDDVSFEVAPGSILTMLGPSGCGKTTVLRCIAGLETAGAGRIEIGGRPVFADGRNLVPAEARNVGMVFQSYAIWPHLTVFDNVAFGLKVRRRPRREIEAAVAAALALVRLPGYADRYPSQLSGGQMQRVVLARCLAYRPALLLLDEPLANLDTNLREEMRAELRRIQRETGTTMIAVTHDQAEALSLSDRILVMDQGCIVQQGAPHEIFERPAAGFVAGFLGAVNAFDGRLEADGRIVVAGAGMLSVPGPLPAPGPVRVYLRPADLAVTETPGDGAWPAVIESTQYLGRSVQYGLRCGDLRLVAEQELHGAPLPEGRRVGLGFAATRARVFAAPGRP